MIQDLILQVKKIDCLSTSSEDLFKTKYNLLNTILAEIKKISDDNKTLAQEQLTTLGCEIINFGYEVSFNRSLEYKVQKYHQQIVNDAVNLAEKILPNKLLLPFLKEESMYVWETVERNILLKKISDIEASING